MKFNFPVVIIDEDFKSENSSGLGIRVLAKAIEELLVNNAEHKKRTDYALHFAAEHQGATQRILDQLKPALQN